MSARSRLRPIAATMSVVALLLGTLTATTPAIAISGGDENVAQLPWVAHLHTTGAGASADCTGSYISEKWILTASHCFTGVSGPISVTIFAMRDGELERVGQGSEHFDHPDLDVSLLRVSQQWQTIPSFAPLGNWVQNGGATVYGYGVTRAGDVSSVPGTLKSARVDIFAFGRRILGNALSILKGYHLTAPWARVLQTFGVNGTPRSGDSGGPLMQNGALVGIAATSGSVRDVQSNPSTFTSVTQVFDWVSQTTGIAAKDLDAATTRSLYTTVLTSANGFNLSTNGSHLVLNTAHSASPLQIEFDGTWAFRLRSESSCVSTADVVSEMTMLVVVRQVLQMEPCDETSFRQKFYLAAQPPTSDGMPRGAVRTVVGDQAVSLLGTGEVGLKSLNDEPIVFVFGASGTTTIEGLAQALKTAGETWATPRAIGKRDAPTIAARFVDANGQASDLPAPPAGVNIMASAAASGDGATVGMLLGDDGHVYRSGRSTATSSFSVWTQLPGENVTNLTSAGNRGSFAYIAGASVVAVDSEGATRTFETPAGVGAVDLAMGDSSVGDQLFILGTDSHVYRYDIGRSSSPSRLPGQDIFTLSASDRDSGGVAYASARTVYLDHLDGSTASYDLPANLTPADLTLSSTPTEEVATVTTTDGAVRQLSASTTGVDASELVETLVVGAGRGVIDARAVPESIGKAIWTNAQTITTAGPRCAPPSLLPAGETVASLSTSTSSSGTTDYALSNSGVLYVSHDCQAWQRIAGAVDHTPAFTSDGGALVLRTLDRRRRNDDGEAESGPSAPSCVPQ